MSYKCLNAIPLPIDFAVKEITSTSANTVIMQQNRRGVWGNHFSVILFSLFLNLVTDARMNHYRCP